MERTLHLIPAGWRRPVGCGEVLRAASFVVRCTGAATLAYIVRNWAGLLHPVWATMSALIVSQEAWTETRASLSARILGTVIGVVVAITVKTAVAEPASLAMQIAVTVAICAAIARGRPAFRVSMWTGPLVLLTAPLLLNGSCSNVCPVKINIHEQIYAWRRELVKRHEVPFTKKAAMKAAGELLSRPAAYRAAIAAADAALAHLPRFVIYNGLNAWGKHREVPHPPKQTFHNWHRQNRGGEK